jgi:hypothetical protein
MNIPVVVAIAPPVVIAQSGAPLGVTALRGTAPHLVVAVAVEAVPSRIEHVMAAATPRHALVALAPREAAKKMFASRRAGVRAVVTTWFGFGRWPAAPGAPGEDRGDQIRL